MTKIILTYLRNKLLAFQIDFQKKKKKTIDLKFVFTITLYSNYIFI